MHSLLLKYFVCLRVLIYQTKFWYFTIFFLSPNYPSMLCFVSLGLQPCRLHSGFANWLRRKKRFAPPICFRFLSVLSPRTSSSQQWQFFPVTSTKLCCFLTPAESASLAPLRDPRPSRGLRFRSEALRLYISKV